MDIQLGFTDRLDNEQNSLSIVKSSKVLKISQDLWKNSFGELQKLNSIHSQFQVEKTKNIYKSRKLEVCQQGIVQYIKLYEAQEKVKVYRKMNQLSKKSISFINRAYKKRMVRKIDFLTANSDGLRLGSLLESKEKDLKKEFS